MLNVHPVLLDDSMCHHVQEFITADVFIHCKFYTFEIINLRVTCEMGFFDIVTRALTYDNFYRLV